MLSSIKLYIALALLAATLVGGLYVHHLRSTVATQAARIENLQATVEAHERALKAVEETNAKRGETQAALEATRKEIESAPEAPDPPAIERALDGLRKHQSEVARPR